MQARNNQNRKPPKAHTTNASPPTQANNATRATNGNPPARSRHMHLTNTPHTHTSHRTLCHRGISHRHSSTAPTAGATGTRAAPGAEAPGGCAHDEAQTCRYRLLGALSVCFRSVLLVRARGPTLRLGVCLLGFPAVVCAVTPIPTIPTRGAVVPHTIEV